MALLGVDKGDNVPPQKPQGHVSLLAIAETVIFIRVGAALEDLFGINEIETVFLEIYTPFSVIPSDHRGIVYTDGICVKEKALRGRYPRSAAPVPRFHWRAPPFQGSRRLRPPPDRLMVPHRGDFALTNLRAPQ